MILIAGMTILNYRQVFIASVDAEWERTLEFSKKDFIRGMPVFVTEGTGAIPFIAGSRTLSTWMKERGFKCSI
jgi:hypothetical protein